MRVMSRRRKFLMGRAWRKSLSDSERNSPGRCPSGFRPFAKSPCRNRRFFRFEKMCRKAGGIWRFRPVDVDSCVTLRLRIFIRALIPPWTQHPQSRPFRQLLLAKGLPQVRATRRTAAKAPSVPCSVGRMRTVFPSLRPWVTEKAFTSSMFSVSSMEQVE